MGVEIGILDAQLSGARRDVRLRKALARSA
jgi:hypothetical protein